MQYIITIYCIFNIDMAIKHVHFIPSDYKVVTEYENTFINDGNKEMAAGVGELLKYIASVTATVIKENDTDVLNIEKSHQEGDIHPNGKWIWKRLPSGKYDWRVIKDLAKKNVWDLDEKINSFTTKKDCVQYVYNLGYLSYNSDLSELDLPSVKSICSVMINLHEVIPYKQITIICVDKQDYVMAARNGRVVFVNKNYFKNFNSDKYWHDSHDKYIDNIKKLIKQTEDNRDYNLKINPDYNTKYDDNFISIQQQTLKSCNNFTYSNKGTVVEDIFIHEMGHILNAQCSGSCGRWKQPDYTLLNTIEEMKYQKKLNAERDEIFDKYLSENKYISKYSTSKNVEFFAECFSAWIHKDNQLPKYISDYFVKYFKTTTPK